METNLSKEASIPGGKEKGKNRFPWDTRVGASRAGNKFKLCLF